MLYHFMKEPDVALLIQKISQFTFSNCSSYSNIELENFKQTAA
jgi:hypothetical protein